MLPNFFKSIAKLCTQSWRKRIIVPLATFGILGFLINTHISLISPNEICYPKTNIVLLKTHKCAGSSIQNILMRYGVTHKLNFVLPKIGNYLGHPALFHRTMIPPPVTFQYNILAHHTRFNYEEIRAVMPRNTIYITIVRDPIHQFESSYSYYNLDKLFKYDIHKFLQNIPKFKNDSLLVKRLSGKFGFNQMLFDLGCDAAFFYNESLVIRYLDKLESWFHLVLVAERMDESLVLLRHLMCWDLDDVVTFKLNARGSHFKSNLTEKEKETILQLNRADAMLYNRFLVKFDKEVEAFGRQRMATEASELNERTRNWYQFCVKDELPLTKDRVPPKHYFNPRVMTFETKNNITNSTCDSMTIEELPYTDNIRKRQMALVPKSFKPNRPRAKSKHSLRRPYKSHMLSKT